MKIGVIGDTRALKTAVIDNDCATIEQEYRYIIVNPSLAYQRAGVNKPRFSLIDTVNQQIKFYTLDMLPLL